MSTEYKWTPTSNSWWIADNTWLQKIPNYRMPYTIPHSLSCFNQIQPDKMHRTKSDDFKGFNKSMCRQNVHIF